jgi:hypothetical protein
LCGMSSARDLRYRRALFQHASQTDVLRLPSCVCALRVHPGRGVTRQPRSEAGRRTHNSSRSPVLAHNSAHHVSHLYHRMHLRVAAACWLLSGLFACALAAEDATFNVTGGAQITFVGRGGEMQAKQCAARSARGDQRPTPALRGASAQPWAARQTWQGCLRVTWLLGGSAPLHLTPSPPAPERKGTCAAAPAAPTRRRLAAAAAPQRQRLQRHHPQVRQAGRGQRPGQAGPHRRLPGRRRHARLHRGGWRWPMHAPAPSSRCRAAAAWQQQA